MLRVPAFCKRLATTIKEPQMTNIKIPYKVFYISKSENIKLFSVSRRVYENKN